MSRQEAQAQGSCTITRPYSSGGSFLALVSNLCGAKKSPLFNIQHHHLPYNTIDTVHNGDRFWSRIYKLYLRAGEGQVSEISVRERSRLSDTANSILCATCGAPMSGNTGMAMCEDCIRLNVDISEGIQREASIHFCSGCERYLQPPQHWVAAALESKELMALCLRRLRGLSKVRLVDASFIWTEPHSKRIKLKIKVQDVSAPGGVLS
jgi:predicted Fe-S protein YdhL (DUF1289 family)